MKIQKKIILIIVIAIIFIPKTVKAEDNTIETQKETFGINSFIENSKQYTGEFFADADISEILNSAISGKVDNSKIYKKILNILGTEVQTGIKSLLSILAIIIIHSILKSISESLENDSISKLIYYVQYIAIVTIIMSNFSDVINLVKQTSNNLIGFMNTLIPVVGLPIKSSTMDGLDSLLSIVQMPPGIPVATVTIDSGINAALMALQIISIKYPKVKEDLVLYRKEMEEKVLEDDKNLRG